MKWSQRARGLALLALGLGAVGLYLLWAGTQGGLGFPLDDAWIHQTYARNLVLTGRWTYTGGRVSAGSTSPLWTLLLVPGHLLGVDPRAWAYALGTALLLGSGWLVWRTGRALGLPEGAAWSLGALVVTEWHMVWAALSGMETSLFAFLSLVLFWRFLRAAEAPRWTAWQAGTLGLLAGLLVLTRPDGLLLAPWLALGGALRLARRGQAPRLLALAAAALAGALIPLAPYLYVNWTASGTPWPNTFYAKQVEYQEVAQALPLGTRLLRLVTTPWVGAQVLLLPGLVALVWPGWRGPVEAGRRVRWALAPLAGWALTAIAVYAVRLPVTYQHGRYLMPVIPALLVLGGIGCWRWAQPRAERTLQRVLSRAWLLGYGVAALAFLALGARAYHWDTRYIETELVATARWLEAHTPEDALIAAHDIGAIGYFGHRDLVDLAGLVSPEVIPFLRDEDALLQHILARGAGYLVTFPSWYPRMVQDPRLQPVFRTEAPWAPLLGGENVVVYRIGEG
ncbi:MAG: hypothetical protein ACUVWW_03685 [Anaerolineae bacterium]